jgi:benzylsuccinate CoA-transferase BbsF subunit
MTVLQGIRVLELVSRDSNAAGRVLAELGADVVRLDSAIGSGADARRPLNAGKRSLSVDLSNPGAGDLVRRLIPGFDAVLNGLEPDDKASLGLDYEEVKAQRPDIIMVSLLSDGDAGTAAGPIAGSLSGLAAAGAVLTALHYRHRSGKGQHIELSRQEAGMPLMAAALLDHQMTGRRPAQPGFRDPYAAPQGCYRCRGDDEWLAISIRDDAEWTAFCEASGHPEWKAERFETILDRRRNHDLLDELIQSWTAGQDRGEAMRLLQDAGVPAAAVLSRAEAPLGAQLGERGLFEDAGDPAQGRRAISRALAARLGGSERSPMPPAPLPGQHNYEVLSEAGFAAPEIAALEAGRIIRAPSQA